MCYQLLHLNSAFMPGGHSEKHRDNGPVSLLSHRGACSEQAGKGLEEFVCAYWGDTPFEFMLKHFFL